MFKVTVSCAGRFHAYDLACQLAKHQLLDRLITTYPKFEIKKFGISPHSITSLLYWEVFNRGWGRFADGMSLNRVYLQFLLAESYDLIAPLFIPKKTDFYIGWSSNSERGLRQARRNGAITILERGSAHIQTQTEILQKEYDEYYEGSSPYFTHEAIIEKEMREYELADFISVPSSFVKQSFLDKGISEKKMIQNIYGVNLSQFALQTRQPRSLFRIIFVGQLSLQKGIHYLLKAFSELQLDNSELLLVGGKNPDIDPYLKKYKGSYRYIGKVAQHELTQWYSTADVFCIPSLQEGFAMVQLQAMACGLPIICTTNTGGGDVVEDGKEGFIIPIRNTEALKEKLVWLYANREACAEMGRNAQVKAATGFTWDDYGARYIDILSRIYAQQ